MESGDLPAKAAVDLVITQMNRALSEIPTPIQTLHTLMRSFATFEWSRSLVERVGLHKLNLLLARLRHSTVDRQLFRETVGCIRAPLVSAQNTVPPKYEQWQTTLDRHSLHRHGGTAGWPATFRSLRVGGVAGPSQLVTLSYDQLQRLLPPNLAAPATLLWQAARSMDQTTGANTAQLQLMAEPARLPSFIRAGSVEDSALAALRNSCKRSLGIQDSFEQLAPAAKAKALASAASDTPLLSRFLDLSAQLNVLQIVRNSLPSVAAGVQGYVDFCALIQVPPFPPTSLIILRWSALFSAGKTFGMYVRHVEKACLLLGLGVDWRSPAVTAAITGLNNAPRLRSRFTNILSFPDLHRFIGHETLQSEFGRLGFLAFLFLLRLQSEALPMRRAFASDPLLPNTPPSGKAVLGLVTIKGEERLVLKLSSRKCTAQTSVLMRPCFCDGGGLFPRSLCPIHALWASVLRSTAPGDLLFPSLAKANINRILKAVLTKAGVVDGSRFSAHCFRRGAANELLRSGSSLATIMKAGGWTSGGYKVYLDLHAEEERQIHTIFQRSSPASGSSSSDEDYEPSTSSLAKRELPFPLLNIGSILLLP